MQSPLTAPNGLLGHLHHWLFDDNNPKGVSREFERFIAVLILVSVGAVLLEHVPEVYEPNAQTFAWFDVISVLIFTLEYVLRVATAPLTPEFARYRFPRLRYMVSFYALVDLIAIAPFYFAQLVTVDVEMLRVLRILRLMRMAKFSRLIIPAWHEFHELNQGRSFRAKLYALLEPTGHSGKLHIYVDNFIVFWVLLSIACVILESVSEIRAIFSTHFLWIDTIAFSIFTLEYLARIYTAPENPEHRERLSPRLAYASSGAALIDLITILPFILEAIWANTLDLRFLRVFRLARMLKLTRYTTATSTLLKVVKREWQVIFASVFVMMLLVILTASLGYLLEHPAQPDKFENIPQAIYWAVITLASVGYGDISPVTPLGRTLTVVLSLTGIGIFAIPAGLLASAFTDQLRIDREAFRRTLVQALQDGEMDPREREEIMVEAERLHLTKVEYDQLMEDAAREHREQMKSESIQLGHLMLDAQTHPALAAEQFRILWLQLALLAQALDRETLKAHLQTQGMQEGGIEQALAALDANLVTDQRRSL